MGAIPSFLVCALGEQRKLPSSPIHYFCGAKQRKDHAVSPIAGAKAGHPPRGCILNGSPRRYRSFLSGGEGQGRAVCS